MASGFLSPLSFLAPLNFLIFQIGPWLKSIILSAVASGLQPTGLTGLLGGRQMRGEALVVAGLAGGGGYRRWNTHRA